MYISIDDYYSVEFYKEAINALKNNNVKYKEYVSIKSPYLWSIELETPPIMVNYDVLTKSEERFLINKVIPNRPNTEYLYMRREDTGLTSLLRYTENEPFKACRSSGVFFHVKNKQELLNISKEYPNKIWFLGKYKGNKYNLCIAENNIIKNYIDSENVLLENTFNEPGRFESEFNYKILAMKEKIVKFDETPYALNGIYKIPNILGEDGKNSSKFILS